MNVTPQVEAMTGMTPLGIKPTNDMIQPDTQAPKQSACLVRFESQYSPELCISSDASRLVLTQVWLDEKEKCFVATNGSMLVTTPIIVENEWDVDASGFYSIAQLVKAKKLAGKGGVAELIVTTDKITFSDGSSEPRLKKDDFGNYPQYQLVIPKADRPVAFEVSFDADFLLSMAKAIGAQSGSCNPKKGRLVTLKFEDKDSPILVSSSSNRECLGVLMPVRTK